MRSVKLFFTGAFLFVAAVVTANTDKQLWFGYIHQGRITPHWGYWVDIHHRTKNEFSKNLHTEIFRFGATYFLDNDWRFTAGYAGVLHFPSVSNQRFMRPEHRPWQQVFYTHTHKNFRTANYIRSEQRLLQNTAAEKLADGFVFRQRFRLSAMFIFCINKKQFKEGSWGVVLNNEVFLNAYASDKAKLYDQNRAFAGLTYNINAALHLQLGYLNVYSLIGTRKETVHGIRLSAFHNFTFTKARF
ncbi:MAG: DUF2490 domain-containing protein [Chitinophagales bacterium]|nr:DUF2490 domain-containing protein [Chitinophagales bacterium]